MVNRVDDLLGRCAWGEDGPSTQDLEAEDIRRWDDAANHNRRIGRALLGKLFDDSCDECHMSTRKNGEPENRCVFGDDGGDYLLRRLVKPGVDDLVACVTKRTSDHFGAAIVSV